MANRHLGAIAKIASILGLAALGLAACAPPTQLPPGPTPIPTLIPVREIAQIVQPISQPEYTIPSYPARMPSAAEGSKIYAVQCAQCHGEDGTGAVPAARNFRDLDYVRGETPANFYAAVAEGRGAMPAFKTKISSDEQWDVVFYLWRLSTSTKTLDQGKQVYAKDCAACHGDDGSGKIVGSADFTNQRQMAQLAPRDLYLTVTQGKGSMPSWQSRLSQDERWAVIDYVRALSYDPALPEATASISATATPSGPLTLTVALSDTAPSSQPAGTAACSGSQANPLAWDDAAAIQAGQAVYDKCAFCHGPTAKGGLPGTPDFTSAKVKADLKSSPGSYFCTLTDGKDAMPPFGNSLSPQERWQVLTYLASLKP